MLAKKSKLLVGLLVLLALLLTASMAFAAKGNPGSPGGGGGGPPEGKGPKEDSAGNNLSYPVIWSEGVTKTLPGEPGMEPTLGGEWWYQWGTNGSDPDVTPASCPPDPDNDAFCDDGVPETFNEALSPGVPPADNPLPLARAYLQKDPDNSWQAFSGTPYQAGLVSSDGDPLHVDWIDWGDNLESVDWYTRSQVRTEVVLFQENLEGALPWLEYEMRHTSGWGIDEVHGIAANLDPVEPIVAPGTMATIFSPCARFTIQLLLVERDDGRLADLVWMPGGGWTEPEGYQDDLINDPIFNMAVHEAGDGPGYYNAEINVKGRIIYGYTWSVRRLNEGAGDYRLTFSFDEECGTSDLNTFFIEGVTEIMVPIEEEVLEAAESEETEGGAVGVLRTDVNLTYMDVRIHERGGGGGGGKKPEK